MIFLSAHVTCRQAAMKCYLTMSVSTVSMLAGDMKEESQFNIIKKSMQIGGGHSFLEMEPVTLYQNASYSLPFLNEVNKKA